MRIKSTILLVLLLLAMLPPGTAKISSDNTLPPAPVFQSLDNTGNPAGSHIYDNNTEITISYKANRYAVDGLVLLGSGSNLTISLSNTDYVRNFTKTSSLRDNSFYSIKLNITSYTYFYAYAYSGNLNNGTYEKLDSLIDSSPGHELWINQGKLYPTFDPTAKVSEIRSGNVYGALNSQVTIQYLMRNNVNEADYATISVAENKSAVFDQNTALVWTNMTKVNYTQIGNYDFSVFQVNVSVTLPVLYFTAFNSYGWERTSATTADIHEISTGFNVSTTYTQPLNKYTSLDNIGFNITTFNETNTMSVGYQYRTFANDSKGVTPSNWTTVDNLVNTTGVLLNSTFDGVTQVNSTLKRTYEVTINQLFDIGNVIEVQQFVRYGTGTNISTSMDRITIIDPSPSLTITSANNTYTRQPSAVVTFSYSTPKGDITSATITQLLPTGVNNSALTILNRVNRTITFAANGNTTILEGNHTLYFKVTNSLGISTTAMIVYHVDQTAPTGTLTPSTTTSTDGKIKLTITFEDTGIDPSGVAYVKLDWGNNMTINAINQTQVEMTYRKSGTYTITMTVYDKAGNSQAFTTSVTVTLPARTPTSNTQNSPVPLLPAMFSLLSLAAISIYRRRKFNLKK